MNGWDVVLCNVDVNVVPVVNNETAQFNDTLRSDIKELL